MAIGRRDIVIFDLGGVLIDWNPRYLYRKLFADEAAMEDFLGTVCTHEWHRHHDAGRSFADGARLLKELHPDKAELIDAFGLRAGEMIGGSIAEAVEVLEALRVRGVRLYGLSNWPAESFPLARERFDFLAWFADIVISGEIGVIKPDPRIFEIALARFAADPARAVFIDDSAANANAAASLGIHAIHYTGSAALRDELAELSLL